MCRFVAYLGQNPIILDEIIDKPKNSLTNQSRYAKEALSGINADGFGIGWYDHSIDDKPGLFKSIQPAWNDQNLHHLSSKIRSRCLVGHVRDTTVGDVSLFNCHPFSHNQFLFAHNGTITGFEKIKRKLQASLSDKAFDIIHGQTDSENFFALVMDIFLKNFADRNTANLFQSIRMAITLLQELQPEPEAIKLNSVLTDGKQLIATRYTSDNNEKALSLYYALGDDIAQPEDSEPTPEHSAQAVLIASEPLTDRAQIWKKVPDNHALIVDPTFHITLQEISI